MDALASSFKSSPELYPHSYEPDADSIGFLHVSRQDLAEASFLDGRLLGPERQLQWMPWPVVDEAVQAAGLEERCGFIFHIGHVGSTLLSRLLDARPDILGLREPMALRTLARLQADPGAPERPLDAAAFDDRLSALLKLWSRPFAEGQLAVIKATSFCCPLAAPILARASRPRAVFMFTAPEVYLATILGGPNNHIDIRAMAEDRLKRLHGRIGASAWALDALSYGEVTAMSWAAEMTALKAASDAAPGQVLWLDFERLLQRPQRWLGAVLEHLGRPAAPEAVAEMAAGPQLQRYSKAPEHAYGPELRRQVLDQARRDHVDQIRRGLDWLERAGAAHPEIASAIESGGA